MHISVLNAFDVAQIHDVRLMHPVKKFGRQDLLKMLERLGDQNFLTGSEVYGGVIAIPFQVGDVVDLNQVLYSGDFQDNGSEFFPVGAFLGLFQYIRIEGRGGQSFDYVNEHLAGDRFEQEIKSMVPEGA